MSRRFGRFDHMLDAPKIMAKGKACISCSQTVAKYLIDGGVKRDRISIIAPGQTIEEGPFTIRVLVGKHIVFDSKLIWTTMFNVMMILHFGSLLRVLRKSVRYKEGQSLIYDIHCIGKRLLHIGSLKFADGEQYPMKIIVPERGKEKTF